MTDMRALTDAFAELERRADAASAAMPLELPQRLQPRRAPRPGWLVPVAATVAVVVGLAAGAALLAPGNTSDTQAATPPTPGASTPAPPTSTSAPSPVPSTPEELAARFRVVLGDTATFTVTDTGASGQMTVPTSQPANSPGQQPPPTEPTPTGAAIVGMLTASGVTGGFDLQIFPTDPRAEAWCDDPDQADCTVVRLADGSSLAIGRVPLQGSPNGITYMANLIRPDGVELLMHVSNERSPKGASEVLSANPPLTTDQMTAILTSDRW